MHLLNALWNFGTAHTFALVTILVLWAQVASAMPSPTLTGFRSTWFYIWAFGFMHVFVAIPRLIITVFPQYAWIFGPDAAQKSMQATDVKNMTAAGSLSVLDPPDKTPR